MAHERGHGRVWLITGASRGLGRVFAQAALDDGDTVVLTARDPGALADLCAAHPESTLALELDVTDREAPQRAVARALDVFGRIDVLVNSAGYGLHAAVEETTEREAREQMETNFFGALWVTQAVMAVMRRQRSGRILQVSSAAGGTGFPMVGLYCASKFALEGMTEALALEAERFGIAVTIVAPQRLPHRVPRLVPRPRGADRREQPRVRGQPRGDVGSPCRLRAGRPARGCARRSRPRPQPEAATQTAARQPLLRRPRRTSSGAARRMGGAGAPGALGGPLRRAVGSRPCTGRAQTADSSSVGCASPTASAPACVSEQPAGRSPWCARRGADRVAHAIARRPPRDSGESGGGR